MKISNSHIIFTLIIILIITIFAMLWNLSRLESSFARSSALRTAEIYSDALGEFRRLYTSEVVARVESAGIDIRHDYSAHEHAIPLPATLSMLLGKNIGETRGGITSHLYSPYPFPWREQTSTGIFNNDAWQYLTSNPDGIFSRFETRNGSTILRYATADIMGNECISCHNSHPDTPKQDWKIGDVRGVLEVRLPMDNFIERTGGDIKQAAVAYFIVGIAMTVGVAIIIIRLRRQSEELQQRVEYRTNNLLTEISERKNAEAKLKRSSNFVNSIVDTVLDGVITIDSHGIVQTFNSAAERIFSYSADEIIGKNVKVLMPEPYYSEHDDYLHNYLGTREAKIIGIGREVEGKRKDGSLFPMELAVSEMIFEDEHMFTGIVRDITERKNIDRMKNEFVSTVSHELRTPLTSIRGAIGLLQGKMSAQLPVEGRTLLEVANRNSERLTLLINDILDMEKLEAGSLEFEFKVIDLVAITTASIKANENYGREKNIRLKFTDHPDQAIVWGDEHRLLQVYANLISNAVKYSPENADVEISIQRCTYGFRVNIRDYGHGIPDEFRSTIFQRFSQVDGSDAREKGGTGLGLSISKAMIEQHHGKIDYESSGAGTCFFFELPEWKEDA